MCLFVWSPTNLGHSPICYHFSKVFFRKKFNFNFCSNQLLTPPPPHNSKRVTKADWLIKIQKRPFLAVINQRDVQDKWLHGMMSNQSSPNIKIAGQGVPDSSLKGVWSVLFSWLSSFPALGSENQKFLLDAANKLVVVGWNHDIWWCVIFPLCWMNFYPILIDICIIIVGLCPIIALRRPQYVSHLYIFEELWKMISNRPVVLVH